MRDPLTTICRDCEDGTRWTSRHGGNDPDVWSTGACETCDGTGIQQVCCEACGEYGADTYHEDLPMHEACAKRASVDDAFVSIGTLMDWLREHVKPPPADLLYEAADATERLRAMVTI